LLFAVAAAAAARKEETERESRRRRRRRVKPSRDAGIIFRDFIYNLARESIN